MVPIDWKVLVDQVSILANRRSSATEAELLSLDNLELGSLNSHLAHAADELRAAIRILDRAKSRHFNNTKNGVTLYRFFNKKTGKIQSCRMTETSDLPKDFLVSFQQRDIEDGCPFCTPFR